MTYALVKGGVVVTFPYSFDQLRRDNPQVSFPRDPTDEALADHGVVRVAPTIPPDVSLTENVTETEPGLVNGVWVQRWNVIAASAEEIAERQRFATDTAARQSVKADAFVSSFIAMTPDEVTNYINANVTNLNSAKAVINKLALMVLLLARREFR